ncbi:MAG: 16S rRNA (cytosine(1402)-N(4))-methyltransferase RsmH [Chloroflexota bacterium]
MVDRMDGVRRQAGGSPEEGGPHRPVLYHEVLEALRPAGGRRYVDGTLGAGGHAAGVLQASAPDGELLGLDVDPQARALAVQRLAEFGPRARIVAGSYVQIDEHLAALGWQRVDGILLDLGLSSMQLDTPERGFSFQADAPLDMRFDPHNPLTAARLVNELPEAELAGILFEYGEEPRSRQLARAIVQARPVETTGQLAEIALKVLGGGRGGPRGGRERRPGGHSQVHPATRTFQALRIAVNHELDGLQQALPKAVAALNPGGRLAVISFHSLEDRIVKQYFRRESQDCICPPRQPVCTCGHRAGIVEVSRRPISPQDDEIERNPRARSARLRIAERLS